MPAHPSHSRPDNVLESRELPRPAHADAAVRLATRAAALAVKPMLAGVDLELLELELDELVAYRRAS